MTRRARVIAYGSASALVVIGVALEAFFSAGAGGLVAVALIGIGFVGLVSLAFLEIGLSEDRDRERGWRGPYDDLGEPGDHAGSADEARAAHQRPKSAPRGVVRPGPLDRRRGQRRRLR